MKRTPPKVEPNFESAGRGDPFESDNVHTLRRLDRHEAKRFLDALHGGDSQLERFTFQTFDEDKKRKEGNEAAGRGDPFASIRPRIFNRVATELEQLNQQSAGVFVTINKTDGKGRRNENVTAVRALFVDLDGAPIEPVKRWGLKPYHGRE